jgi:hypothetical protein
MMVLRCCLLLAAALLEPRPIVFSDIPEPLRPLIASDEAAFTALRTAIERDTEERLRRGEDEHLIYFILQSRSFTRWPVIEPALSARDYHESHKAPPAVRERMKEFLQALERPKGGERLAWWKLHLPASRRTLAGLEDAYAAAMRFLWQKEFGGAGPEVYQTRGHSTDTQVEANYSVATALAILRVLDPKARLNHVLIVGPGLDFAPRTGFRDDIPPQSFQPYAVADALLSQGLADPKRLSIDAVDINPRVIGFIENFARETAPVLRLPPSTGDSDYQEYFRNLGRHIGTVAEDDHGKVTRVRGELARRIHAGRLNILTERYTPSRGYDLAIATNVLLYFKTQELALALANIHAMMRDGAYLIHNELRPDVETITRALDMPPIQGRTLRVAAGTKAPQLDAFVIHHKVRAKR